MKGYIVRSKPFYSLGPKHIVILPGTLLLLVSGTSFKRQSWYKHVCLQQVLLFFCVSLYIHCTPFCTRLVFFFVSFILELVLHYQFIQSYHILFDKLSHYGCTTVYSLILALGNAHISCCYRTAVIPCYPGVAVSVGKLNSQEQNFPGHRIGTKFVLFYGLWESDVFLHKHECFKLIFFSLLVDWLLRTQKTFSHGNYV